MLFEFGFYSSLLLITFSQGLIYSFLFFKKGFRTGLASHYWLGLFILLCSLYVAPWMLGFAGWYDNQPYRNILFYMPFQQLYLFGPVLYFYTQSLLNPSFRFSRKMALHFLPAAVFLLYNLLMWLYDSYIADDIYFYADATDKDFDTWYQYSGLVSMAFYLLLTLRYYNLYKKFVFQITSDAEGILFRWIKTYLIVFLILMLLPVVFDLAGLILPEIRTYKGSWWFFLSFSIVMYYLAITAYSNPVSSRIGFRLPMFESKPLYFLTNPQTLEDEIIEVDIPEGELSDEVLQWKTEIDKIISTAELYKNPELTLLQLANNLGTNPTVISKAVNQGFGINFNDLINRYRIEAVKESFGKGAHRSITILGIAYDCGFNSKATFNRAFKKHTGLSPKDYLAQQY